MKTRLKGLFGGFTRFAVATTAAFAMCFAFFVGSATWDPTKTFTTATAGSTAEIHWATTGTSEGTDDIMMAYYEGTATAPTADTRDPFRPDEMGVILALSTNDAKTAAAWPINDAGADPWFNSASNDDGGHGKVATHGSKVLPAEIDLI